MMLNFKHPELFVTALTHRSALNEHLSSSSESNERLEFLGDAVLELVTTRYLYDHFPNEQEGMLTAYRSALVKTTTLAEVARTLDFGNQLIMSKGEEASGGRDNVGLLANTVEAVIGALYLDQGIAAAESFIAEHLLPKLAKIQQHKLYKDAKSQLQELVQSKGFEAPDYKVTDEQGPDHDREFTVEVWVHGQVCGQGTGKSKQLAQQAAAQSVLEHPPQILT